MTHQPATDEPFCTIEWHGDDYLRAVFHDGAGLSVEQREELCWRQLADAAATADTEAALREAVDRIAANNGLRAEWLEGGHIDPLKTTAAFTLWPTG